MAVNNYKTVDGKEIGDWNEYVHKLIKVFRPTLLDTMRVSHLLCLLDIEEVKDRAGIIHQKENSGDLKGASQDLLDAIEKAEEPGKWVMFIDALKTVENSVILDILLDEKKQDPQKWLSDDENRHIIRIFSYDIQRRLRLPPEMLAKLWDKKLILKKDQDLLRSLMTQGKREDAVSVLLVVMHRNTCDWYHAFLGILCDDEQQADLAEQIDPEFCEKRRKHQLGGGGEEEEEEEEEEVKEPQSLSSDQAQPSQASSVQKKPAEKEQSKAEAAAGNLPAEAPSSEKAVVGGETLPHAEDPDSKGDLALSPDVTKPREGEATCQCQCCAKVVSTVTSLQSELAEMKALLRYLINERNQK